MDDFTKELIAAGHVTFEEPKFTGPQTTSGYYKATNGFWYFLGWNNGRQTGGTVGYSSAYREAEDALAYKGIQQDDKYVDAHRRWEKAMRRELGLAEVN